MTHKTQCTSPRDLSQVIAARITPKTAPESFSQVIGKARSKNDKRERYQLTTNS